MPNQNEIERQIYVTFITFFFLRRDECVVGCVVAGEGGWSEELFGSLSVSLLEDEQGTFDRAAQ